MAWYCTQCGHKWKPKTQKKKIGYMVHEYQNIKNPKCPKCGNKDVMWVF